MARDPYKYFRIEARDLIDQLGQNLLEFERAGSGGDVVPRLLRLAHTLKGAARVVRQPEIADRAHSIEDLLTPFRETTDAVPRDTMDGLLALLDGIAQRVSGLQAPAAPAEAEPPGKAAPVAARVEEEVRGIAADVGEIDGLFDSVSEAYAQLNGLAAISELATAARRIADQLTDWMQRGDAVSHQAADESLSQLQSLTTRIEHGVRSTHERVDREVRSVLDAVEQLRLVPAGALFPSLERAGRDSARALGKSVVFEGKGAEIRLDSKVLRIVQDALTQLIRNAVAHGIEAPADREAAGKPPEGRVSFTLQRRGRRIVFRCEDDGRGIDVAALRDAATKKGRDVSDLDETDGTSLARHLLRGGISTSTVLSEVAGRGIGMDIVREAVAQLRAEFVVRSVAGKGTVFELVVPQSVASVEALIIEGAGTVATIPLHAIRHAIRLAPGDIHRTAQGEAIVFEGRSVPLISLAQVLGRTVPGRGGSLSAIIVNAAGGLTAIGVNRLRGTANVVLRTLPEFAPSTSAIAGASLDANGRPLLMLDPDGIAATGAKGAATSRGIDTQLQILVIDDSLTTRMLEQSILESAGYKVDLAVSAEEGLERARAGRYALILCDVEMPGMDGFGFVEEIRRDPDLRDTPAILVTSRNAPEDKRRGKAVGAQGYVVKSEFDQADLLDHIRRLVA